MPALAVGRQITILVIVHRDGAFLIHRYAEARAKFVLSAYPLSLGTLATVIGIKTHASLRDAILAEANLLGADVAARAVGTRISA